MKTVGLFACAALLAELSLAGPGAEECLDCHDAEEYSDMNAADLLEELKAPSIKAHLDYENITLEQVEAILAEPDLQ